MFNPMKSSFRAANFSGRFLSLRYENGMHWKASIATVAAIAQT